jgi:hypothetical protein
VGIIEYVKGAIGAVVAAGGFKVYPEAPRAGVDPIFPRLSCATT